MDDNGGEELRRIRGNDPDITSLYSDEIDENYIQNMTDEDWEELGRDIANNTHLESLYVSYGFLNDQRVSFSFRGLKRSTSIAEVHLYNNQLSAAGIQSMVPFLQDANKLICLNLDSNNIQSEGFNFLLRSLRDSPIEMLYCCRCGIASIEIDIGNKPKHLKKLLLDSNRINADGCRELVKLLQGGDATLTELHLQANKIDDEGVAILVNALQNNTALKTLYLCCNDDISKQGEIMLLKLVNDISSIEATLQSNFLDIHLGFELYRTEQIVRQINMASKINRLPGEAGREKVIQTQLNSKRRAELAAMQGANNESLYSEIDPLHLPEVLALVGRHHGQGELFVALRSSIAEVMSTVNRKECLKQENSYYSAKIAEFRAKMEANEAELAIIEASEASVVNFGSESRCNKRRRAS